MSITTAILWVITTLSAERDYANNSSSSNPKQERYMYMQQADGELLGEFPKQVLNVGVMSQHGDDVRADLMKVESLCVCEYRWLVYLAP